METPERIKAGWLYANLNEYDFLRELGVFGPMHYTEFDDDNPSIPLIKGSKQGIISYCFCTEETLLKLEKHYHEWWKNNYIYYCSRSNKYPSNHFSEVTRQWLSKHRSSKYEAKT